VNRLSLAILYMALYQVHLVVSLVHLDGNQDTA
jgi:hypothetical protein